MKSMRTIFICIIVAFVTIHPRCLTYTIVKRTGSQVSVIRPYLLICKEVTIIGNVQVILFKKVEKFNLCPFGRVKLKSFEKLNKVADRISLMKEFYNTRRQSCVDDGILVIQLIVNNGNVVTEMTGQC